MGVPISTVHRSATTITRQVKRRQRRIAAVQTIDVVEFYDGNGDRQSIAPRVGNEEDGPAFEAIRDTLVSIARRPRVRAVGVEAFELPDPDNPADDDVWIEAGRVFVWTTEPLDTVARWVRPLKPSGVGRANVRSVKPPTDERLPPGTRAYRIGWD